MTSPISFFVTMKTNVRRLFHQPEAKGFFKDAFHEYVIAGNKSAVNPAQTGTKAGVVLRTDRGGGTISNLRAVAAGKKSERALSRSAMG